MSDTRLEKLARQAVAELGNAHWYPGFTDKQPRSIELLRRYFKIVDAKKVGRT